MLDKIYETIYEKKSKMFPNKRFHSKLSEDFLVSRKLTDVLLWLKTRQKEILYWEAFANKFICCHRFSLEFTF